MFRIYCSRCSAETGAWFCDGDPYLPYIVCEDCADKIKSEDDEVPNQETGRGT